MPRKPKHKLIDHRSTFDSVPGSPPSWSDFFFFFFFSLSLEVFGTHDPLGHTICHYVTYAWNNNEVRVRPPSQKRRRATMFKCVHIHERRVWLTYLYWRNSLSNTFTTVIGIFLSLFLHRLQACPGKFSGVQMPPQGFMRNTEHFIKIAQVICSVI